MGKDESAEFKDAIRACDHHVVPNPDDPGWGYCTKCGDDTFPLTEWAARGEDPQVAQQIPLEELRRLARWYMELMLESSCDHEWVDARNEVVQSGEVCVKCNAVRSSNGKTNEDIAVWERAANYWHREHKVLDRKLVAYREALVDQRCAIGREVRRRMDESKDVAVQDALADLDKWIARPVNYDKSWYSKKISNMPCLYCERPMHSEDGRTWCTNPNCPGSVGNPR